QYGIDEITQTDGRTVQHNVVTHMQFTRNTSGRKYFYIELSNACWGAKKPFATSRPRPPGNRNKNSCDVIYRSKISVKNVDFCGGSEKT
ncbi:MAG TPA: hypothetical protein PKE04_06425, partial [Clostridia bacterium]|nr:hypothetical protein [Clostridia bacterium]